MSRFTRAVLVATSLTLNVGCGGVDFDPENELRSVRVIGTRADKPYAKPGDTVSLDTLSFDGRASQPEPLKTWWLPAPCVDPQDDGFYSCYPALTKDLRPGEDLGPRLLEANTFSFQLPTDIIANHQGSRGNVPYGLAIVFSMTCAGHVEYLPPPPGSNVDTLPFGCFDQAHRRLGPSDYVFAFSSVFSFDARTNANPVLDHLSFGGAAVDPTIGINVAHCTQAKLDDCPGTALDTIVPEASQELDPGNTDADGNVLKEQIWVDYLVTGGKAKEDTEILFDPRAGRLSNTADQLYAPQAPGDYLLWAVIRDNRGGSAWLQVPLHAN